MLTDLKPCPFCGGDPDFDHDDDGWNWIVCQRCGATTNASASLMDDCKPLLAERWNSRAIAAEVRAEAQEPITSELISSALAAITFYGSQKWAEGKGLISNPALLDVRQSWDAVYAAIQKLAAPQPPAPCPKCAELESIIAEEMPATYVVYAMRDALQAKVAEQSAEIERLRAMLPTPASQLGCTSLSDWRFAAMYFESQWKACSHDFNAVAGARDVIIAQQAGRIAELEAKEFDWAKANAKCTDAIAKQSALIEKCEKALIEARDDVYSELIRAKQSAGYKRYDDEIKRQMAQLVRHDEALAAIAAHRGQS